MDVNQKHWLSYIQGLQSLTQAGLTYGQDTFDLERYQRIRDISASMLSDLPNELIEVIRDLFCSETGNRI